MDKPLKHHGLNEEMYTETLSNGLKCFFIPKKNFTEKYAMLAVNFGSVDLDFEVNEEIFNTPQGIAHFLEHKAFEDDTIEYFDEFTKLSGNVNAYTNFNNTVYYFSCNENFFECLSLLFDMVLNLYITDETVEKEKGIIEQEISMYDDDPSWRVYFNMLQGLYEKCPVRNEIAGTASSIKEIDRNLLKKCFDTFYTPSNMALVCSGDFDLEKVLRIAEDKTKSIASPSVRKIYPGDNDAAFKTRIEDKMLVSKPLFCLGWKDIGYSNDLDHIISTKILLDIISGGSSEVFNRLYKEGILDSSFGMDYSNGICFGTTMFSGASKDIDRVCDEITHAVELINRSGVNSETFSRIKKKHVGRFMKGFNSVSGIASMQAEFYPKGFNVFDLADKLENIEIDQINKRTASLFGESNFCLSVVDRL